VHQIRERLLNAKKGLPAKEERKATSHKERSKSHISNLDFLLGLMKSTIIPNRFLEFVVLRMFLDANK